MRFRPDRGPTRVRAPEPQIRACWILPRPDNGRTLLFILPATPDPRGDEPTSTPPSRRRMETRDPCGPFPTSLPDREQPNAGDRRFVHERVSQRSVDRVSDADPATDEDGIHPLHARSNLDPTAGHHVLAIILPRNTQDPTEPAGTRSGLGGQSLHRARAHQDGLPAPRHEVRADDLVNPIHVEGSGP